MTADELLLSDCTMYPHQHQGEDNNIAVPEWAHKMCQDCVRAEGRQVLSTWRAMNPYTKFSSAVLVLPPP